ncbi:hypothetical protein LSH36_349g03001 [Paralvinella palmiformis]|uniref:RING-type E3 ubiquitin transferase n=1 Tax=Paralvinella palmiformis TaxID=53620 RepID=A0AAD9N2H9_9ANNE|nr:hypothetical protein LSH36_349g03001 [Paralvinella palmiformis]
MGAFASRRNMGVEEVDISTNNAYRFPPKSGCYFGSHFIMGGDRFETTQPESYLFGENQDLNFLGNRPIPFPYPAPQAHEPTKTLKSLVNIRKESLKFVKVNEEDAASKGHTSPAQSIDQDLTSDSQSVTSQSNSEQITQSDEISQKYNIEFTFDTDVKCAITIYYFATEEISNKQAVYRPRDPLMNSETFHYKRGANQTFCQSTHVIEPQKFSDEEWQYNSDKDVIPIVIQCVVEEEEYIGHSHMTFAVVERVEGGFSLKALKQKQMVDGLCYLLQEIYGIENKNLDRPKDDDLEDTSSECVICLVEMRDTLILPCRHLCLCNGCADNLRYQASNCPICRSPFRALLQIRAMRKKVTQLPLPSSQTSNTDTSEETSPSQEGIPPGYEAVSLLEALNGTSMPSITTGTTRNSYPDATERATANSQTASPEQSPLVSRRRLRRKASSSSGRSIHSHKGSSHLEEAKEEMHNLVSPAVDKQRSSAVPDATVCVVRSDSSKSSGKSRNSSKHSQSQTNKPGSDTGQHTDDNFDGICVDIVNETAKMPRPTSLVSAGSVTEAGDIDRRERCETDYECIDHSKIERSSSEADYEYIDPLKMEQAVTDDPDIRYEPSPVMMRKQPTAAGDDVPDSVTSTNMDHILPSISGQPDGSGSSYSSTESTKGLLEHQGPIKRRSLSSDREDPTMA